MALARDVAHTWREGSATPLHYVLEDFAQPGLLLLAAAFRRRGKRARAPAPQYGPPPCPAAEFRTVLAYPHDQYRARAASPTATAERSLDVLRWTLADPVATIAARAFIWARPRAA